MTIFSRSWPRGAALVAGAAALCGCVTVAAYDNKTDQMLTQLQSDTDQFIAQLTDSYDATTTPQKACAYSANIKTMEGFRTSLSLLSTRLNAINNNDLSKAAFGHLSDAYASFEAAYKYAEVKRADHCIIPALLVTDQAALDSAVGGLLKLELAKKKGGL